MMRKKPRAPGRFGRWIRRHLKRKHWTESYLADRLEVHVQQVSRHIYADWLPREERIKEYERALRARFNRNGR